MVIYINFHIKDILKVKDTILQCSFVMSAIYRIVAAIARSVQWTRSTIHPHNNTILAISQGHPCILNEMSTDHRNSTNNPHSLSQTKMHTCCQYHNRLYNDTAWVYIDKLALCDHLLTLAETQAFTHSRLLLQHRGDVSRGS